VQAAFDRSLRGPAGFWSGAAEAVTGIRDGTAAPGYEGFMVGQLPNTLTPRGVYEVDHCNFAYSALACFRMGTSGQGRCKSRA
jgi:hypothetical protein